MALDMAFFDNVLASDGGQDILEESLIDAGIEGSADATSAPAPAAVVGKPPVPKKKRKLAKQPQPQPRNEAKEIDYLASLDVEGIKALIERSCYYLKDLTVGALIVVRSHRMQEGGKWGPVPIVHGDFDGHAGVDLALPQRYKGKLDDRILPFYMVYTGTVAYKDRILQTADFVDMTILGRRLSAA